ncbi:MAG: SMI1/KNR4 family protein [Lachnospiraceae bacterium]|nr:SMI1/KNR4 family protein [Ruminococcus sp.]MCM1276397.1 SMI1/KNR4 family protein [Lachnospiraceae bacterium]
MKLAELEKRFGISFPEKFKKICDTGAMEYLELSLAEFQKIRGKYISDPKAFMMLNGDCEPLFFEEIPQRSEELGDWLSWRTEDEKETLREGVRLVPFAHTGGGDLYLFVYDGEAEPSVVLYRHDCYDAPMLCGRDFDEFLYYALLDVLQWNGEDMNGAAWRAHLDYLSDEYREKITGKSVGQLLDDFGRLGLELDGNAAALFDR